MGSIKNDLPSYRLILDDCLIIERKIYWDSNTVFVRESCIVELETGIHTLSLLPVIENKRFIPMVMTNIKANDNKVNIIQSKGRYGSIHREFEIT
jgi:hypothetical protein